MLVNPGILVTDLGGKKHEFKIAKFHFLSEFHNGILLYADQFFHNDYPDFYGFEVKFGFGFGFCR